MALDAGMDTGPTLMKQSVPIAPEDTTATLSERLAIVGAELLLEGVALVASGEARFTPQDESRATYTKLYEKAHGRIVWGASARDIHNLVRAAVPWPVAHCRFRGETFRILESEIAPDGGGGAPGEVLGAGKDGIVVAAGEGALSLRVVQAPGKKAMPVEAFLRGHPIEAGESFGDL